VGLRQPPTKQHNLGFPGGLRRHVCDIHRSSPACYFGIAST
jgi:hypothetical protein